MKKAKGFTLIELMIVVAIIGILSAIAIPKFADLIRKSNEGATKGNLGAIRSAVSIYYGEQEGWYPSGAAVNLGAVLTMENGKYLKEVPACYAAGHHAKSTVFSVAATSATDGGAWGYGWDDTPTGAQKLWGDVWVDCSHTDSKATTWSFY